MPTQAGGELAAQRRMEETRRHWPARGARPADMTLAVASSRHLAPGRAPDPDEPVSPPSPEYRRCSCRRARPEVPVNAGLRRPAAMALCRAVRAAHAARAAAGASPRGRGARRARRRGRPHREVQRGRCARRRGALRAVHGALPPRTPRGRSAARRTVLCRRARPAVAPPRGPRRDASRWPRPATWLGRRAGFRAGVCDLARPAEAASALAACAATRSGQSPGRGARLTPGMFADSLARAVTDASWPSRSRRVGRYMRADVTRPGSGPPAALPMLVQFSSPRSTGRAAAGSS